MSQDELNVEMSKKVSIDDVKSFIDNDLSKIEFKREVNNLKTDLEENHQ